MFQLWRMERVDALAVDAATRPQAWGKDFAVLRETVVQFAATSRDCLEAAERPIDVPMSTKMEDGFWHAR
eukprot:8534786-Prorocentrum_lima.AAC.1